ncbi:MAG: GNAT family N-acetyltransferase [Anaerolineae bacterium]|nr:GNAT family N-acetyltransferase [Anaerolineae bacterium]
MIAALRGAIHALLGRILGLSCARRLLGPFLCVDYTIRRVDPGEDLDALAACGATLSASPPEAIRRDFRLEFAGQDPQRWLFLIAKDRTGRVLGFVRAMRQGLEQDWRIAGLGVRPLFRRRGIGEALVSEVLANLREGGVHQVRLEVNRASLPAIALYRKLGFKEMLDSGERTGDGDFLQMVKTS